MKVKGPTFEIQDYMFNSVPKEDTNKYKSKVELLNSYRYAGEKDFKEKLKLCDEVGKFPSLDTSLVTVRDQARGTLNLPIITGGKVAKLKVDPKKVPKTDVIRLR